MKSKQQLPKKLVLNKETVRVLTDSELNAVAGGVTRTNGCGTNTCDTCLRTYPCYTDIVEPIPTTTVA